MYLASSLVKRSARTNQYKVKVAQDDDSGTGGHKYAT